MLNITLTLFQHGRSGHLWQHVQKLVDRDLHRRHETAQLAMCLTVVLCQENGGLLTFATMDHVHVSEKVNFYYLAFL